jgi:hypothetical protein
MWYRWRPIRVRVRDVVRGIILSGLVTSVFLLMTGTASAAAPWWHLLTLSAPPGDAGSQGEVVFYAADLGNAPASDLTHPVTVRDVLPVGVQAKSVHPTGSGGALGYDEQYKHDTCTITGREVTCTYSLPVLPFEGVVMVIDVKVVTPGAVTGENEATVSGGLLGPMTQRQALTLEGTPSYGAAHLDLSPEEADGTPALRAGSHPFQLTSTFALNTQAVPIVNGLHENILELEPLGLTKDLRFNVPPGLIANATAVEQCPDYVFTQQVNLRPGFKCPDDTAIGVANSMAAENRPISPEIFAAPIYNLVPAYGEPARFGFVTAVGPVILDTAVKVAGGETGVTVLASNITQEGAVIGAQTTFWGWPGDPRHDDQRGECVLEGNPDGQLASCPGPSSSKPLLVMPTSCAGPLPTTVEADTWQEPVLLAPFSAEPIPALRACNQVPFAPSLDAGASTDKASAPTGLDLKIDFHDEGLVNPEGVSQSQIEKTVVTLPEGMTVNPSAGVGLGACTRADYERETVNSEPGEGCPNDSKLGTVTIESPLLAATIEGNVYIAQPYENPFPEPAAGHPGGTLLALYIVAKNPENGILVKLAGKVVPDPVTGRLSTIFENVPQVAFDHFNFHFREGQQAPLISPPACGTYMVEAQLSPWSEPANLLTDTAPFQITKGFDGGECPPGGIPPFDPQIISGTENNRAGSYSPFYLRILRNDNEQELTKFTAVLPPGLTANLTGIPFCSDAQIQAAREHTGQQELHEPSCPPASEIGHTLVGAGVGTVLAWTPGKIYLAGSYHGQALSIVSITSATVGPFDLGTVVIRFALRINPVTGQAEIDGSSSDPIPHIIDGIVVHVREIHAYVDRPNFMINPTSCEAMNVQGAIAGAGANASGTGAETVDATSRFQASECASLSFKPVFKAQASGKTSRRLGASLHVTLTYPNLPQGTQANIHSVKVDLPKQLPSRLTTLQKACTDTTFDANPAACPAASRVGISKAITPILPVPLEGPAYFVSHGGAKFPELIVVLQGYGVTIMLHGETFISKAGITSSTFRSVPDEPVTSFELTLPQGPYSALAANGNLCAPTKTILRKRKITIRIDGRNKTVTRNVKTTLPTTLVMPTAFTAQNGMTLKQNTPITITGCTPHKTNNTKTNQHNKKA